MSDDRPKKSWRELDRGRDQSRHRQEERPARGPKSGPGSQKSYRAALDRLFESGKIADLVEQRDPTAAKKDEADESRLKLLGRIKQAVGRDEITREVDAYLKQFELPDDLEILGQVLEHRDVNLQLRAMERIDALLETQRPKRFRGMIGQLKLIRDMDLDREMTELADRLIERLQKLS